MSQKYCLVYSTCPNLGIFAKKISKALISKKLAACVTIMNNVTSIYTWENNIECSKEKLLIIKTYRSLFKLVKEEIIKLHPYKCPEIIMIPIIEGYKNYMSWLDSCLL